MWDAFWDLNGDRPLGFGVVGPIPWSAIERYAERSGIAGRDEFGRFLRLIRALDGEWRKVMREETEKDS